MQQFAVPEEAVAFPFEAVEKIPEAELVQAEEVAEGNQAAEARKSCCCAALESRLAQIELILATIMSHLPSLKASHDSQNLPTSSQIHVPPTRLSTYQPVIL